MDVIDTKARQREYLKEWHIRNRDRRSEEQKQRRLADPEKYRKRSAESQKRRREKDYEKYIAPSKRYREKHRYALNQRQKEKYWTDAAAKREKRNAYLRNRYPLRKDILLQRSKEYHLKNKDKIRAQQKEYRLRNLDKKLAACRAWHKAHRHDPIFVAKRRKKDIPYQQKRRALRRGATINLAKIKEWMNSVQSKVTAVCYWCHSRVSTKTIHFDHIIALSKGGPHSVENLCVSCAFCNLSKSNKPVRVWTKVGQQMLEL